jgi:hypothetical protein
MVPGRRKQKQPHGPTHMIAFGAKQSHRHYHKGWTAVTNHSVPWVMEPPH